MTEDTWTLPFFLSEVCKGQHKLRGALLSPRMWSNHCIALKYKSFKGSFNSIFIPDLAHAAMPERKWSIWGRAPYLSKERYNYAFILELIKVDSVFSGCNFFPLTLIYRTKPKNTRSWARILMASMCLGWSSFVLFLEWLLGKWERKAKCLWIFSMHWMKLQWE